MDTVVGDKNITELFGYKYDELYNSVSYGKDEFLTLTTTVKAYQLHSGEYSF